MYKHSKTEKEQNLLKEYLSVTCDKESSSVGLKDALTHPHYRRATWVNFGHIIFHELTGINVIIQYSNQIFTQMHNGGLSLTPHQGTFMIGIVHLLGTSCSLLGIKSF